MVVLLLAAAVLVGVDLGRGGDRIELAAVRPAPSSASAAEPSPTAVPSPAPVPSPTAASPTPAPTAGAGTFGYAAGPGAVLGTAGALRRFQVAVEAGTGEDTTTFAAAVDAVLGDPRSWIAGGQVRLQRVGAGEAHEFTIYLASAATSTRMCAAGGLDTDGYTSCRLPGQVIVNLTRWTQAVPGYGAPLDAYRAYAVNHEVGHQLGYGHEACPGAGRPAPVMQQQTLGLRGCTAYSWPYLDGRRYAGARIP